MSTKHGSDLEDELDRLYQAPLDQFVRERNELAARLRARGEAEDALRVHALARPPQSAWAVNQLYWRARAEYDALMKAGRALRDAQAASATGDAGSVREAGRARDRALQPALKRALAAITDAGQSASPAMRVRIATNLEALAAHGGEPPRTKPGRLTEDLDLPGFEVFEGMAMQGRPAAHPSPEPPRRASPATVKVVSLEAIRNAKRAVTEAERAAAERRADAQRARAALNAAERSVKEAEQDVAAARAALDAAAATLQEAAAAVPDCQQAVVRAQTAADEANVAVQQAREDLEQVLRKRL